VRTCALGRSRPLGCSDDCTNTKSLWFASNTLFEQDGTLAGVQTLPLVRPDGHNGKSTLTSVKLSKSSLSQNLPFF